jgi:holo-[acyl-carrier protein] synthase
VHVHSHGIDLCAIARIADMLERHGDSFRRRCFTEEEQAYADSATRRQAERYAARFAAKEAVLKALGTGWRNGIAWTDIAVRRDPQGRPFVVLSGRCAELAAEQGIRDWHLSLSHAGDYAMASVIAVA